MGFLEGLFKTIANAAGADGANDSEGFFETGTCPKCGNEMHRRYSYSDWWCDTCHAGPYDDEDEEGNTDDESLSVYDAADIWVSSGRDEDYTFDYTEEELERAYRQ